MKRITVTSREIKGGVKALTYGGLIVFFFNFLLLWAAPDVPWDTALVRAANYLFFVELISILFLWAVYVLFCKKV